MAARNVLKNFNLFVDGRGLAGQIEEFTPPKLNLKVDEFRAGGMDAPLAIPMGMEKLESSASILCYDISVLAAWGIASGNSTRFVTRGALESMDGTVTPIVHTMAGRIREIDYGSYKPGDKAPVKITMDLTFYRFEQGDLVVHEVDVENMTRIVNGVDVLAAQRSALGG